MIALIQRVISASVRVEKDNVASIDKGLLVFIGISSEDCDEDINYIVDKVSNLRVFSNAGGQFDYSLFEISGSILLVSQFTLMGSTKKGRRPSFQGAMDPINASSLYSRLVNKFAETGLDVHSGKFQAHMEVSLVNDGPVTIIIDSKK
ncbi:MAG: D-aminoacyl-tRNA deacylase [SAR202 cluster bacterium]|nr:D-aminoacyl-tRNA deacylase [SAR202 cluster bacterium]|tara:strand:+ start:30 stop:473 length:444 start_codon:yes stop_codon:yes gene_type:complete